MTQEKIAHITCIVCPNGCQITVIDRPGCPLEIEGATCKRGAEYAEQEYREPKRMLITTMRVDGGTLAVIPVRSDRELPKERIFEAVEHVSHIALRAPIKMGTVVVPNLLNLGVDVIASRDIKRGSVILSSPQATKNLGRGGDAPPPPDPSLRSG